MIYSNVVGIENTKNRKLSEDEQSLFDGWEWVFGQGYKNHFTHFLLIN
jgi:hypothetical protein